MVVGKREKQKMRKLRSEGKTYREIQKRVNRSLQTIIKYTKDVIPANSIQHYKQTIKNLKEHIKEQNKELTKQDKVIRKQRKQINRIKKNYSM